MGANGTRGGVVAVVRRRAVATRGARQVRWASEEEEGGEAKASAREEEEEEEEEEEDAVEPTAEEEVARLVEEIKEGMTRLEKAQAGREEGEARAKALAEQAVLARTRGMRALRTRRVGDERDE